MSRMLRSAPLHFLVLGALLFALRSGDGRPSIVITVDDVASLRRAFAAEHGAPPSPAVETGLIDAAVDEQVLLREARAAGLDGADRAVRERLARLSEFLEERDGADGLDLADADVVVRRHLVDTMRVLLAGTGPDAGPAPAEIAAYVARHRERFVEPVRVRLTQVHLGRRRGAALRQDAARLLAELRRAAVPPAEAAGLGDPFPSAATASATRADLDRRFGPGFGDAVGRIAPGTWEGPVPSSYGLHLVWVHERTAERMVGAEELERRATLLVRRERDAGRLRERLRLLRARYDIRVE